jgi:hypothetical protein
VNGGWSNANCGRCTPWCVNRNRVGADVDSGLRGLGKLSPASQNPQIWGYPAASGFFFAVAF